MWELYVAVYSNLSTMYYNCCAEIVSVRYHSNIEFFHETLTAIDPLLQIITHGNANCNPYTLIWKAEGGFGCSKCRGWLSLLAVLYSVCSSVVDHGTLELHPCH